MKPYHPAWKILYDVLLILAIVLSVGFILWLNASSFDKTEIKSLLHLLGLLIAWFTGKKVLGGRARRRSNNNTNEAEPLNQAKTFMARQPRSSTGAPVRRIVREIDCSWPLPSRKVNLTERRRRLSTG